MDALHYLQPIAETYGRDIQEVVGITSKASSITVSPLLKQRIADWTSSGRSEALWIQGPYNGYSPSQSAFTAVCLVALSSQNDIPCISYFCTLSNANVSSMSRASPEKLLSDLVKSVITQIVLLLRKNPPISSDLLPSRFEQLTKDGDFDFDYGVQLLHDVRALTPAYLHCIIEGGHMLEDRENSTHTRNLERILKELVPSGEDELETCHDGQHETSGEVAEPEIQRIVKTCFTTDGYMDALARLVDGHKLKKITHEDESDELWIERGRRLMPHWSDNMV